MKRKIKLENQRELTSNHPHEGNSYGKEDEITIESFVTAKEDTSVFCMKHKKKMLKALL